MTEMTIDEVMAQAATVKEDTVKKLDEISILFTGPITLTIAGEEITIKPFTFGQLPHAMRLLRSVGGIFAEHYRAGTLKTEAAIFDIIGFGGEDLIDLIGLNIGKPRAYFDTLQVDEGAILARTFVEVNVGFFTNKVVPMLMQKS